MSVYVDSSVLVALYLPERHSEAAHGAVRALPQVPFTRLHELEMENAFALLVGRGAITAAEYEAVSAQWREDLEAQRLAPMPVDWDATLVKACELSSRHSKRTLARSLDVLHVAAAHVLGARTLVSADERQLAIAKASGLRIRDIRIASRA